MPLLSIVRSRHAARERRSFRPLSSPADVEYAEDSRYFRRDGKLTRLASVLNRVLELDILHAEIAAPQYEPVIMYSGDIAVGPRRRNQRIMAPHL